MTATDRRADRLVATLATRASRAERLAAADDVIDNSGTLDGLHAQVDGLHQRYVRAAAGAS